MCLPNTTKVQLRARPVFIGKVSDGEGELDQRSFVRKWTLPENVDLEALRTQLNDAGHLSVEAPKVGQPGAQKRSIPIERVPSQL
ncbi:unnamed protein product [Angiostrongylus costaricensis]|uniref:SHSP domain-containing protein n=1 Tax=Angiostrongylus costaricensis TaxID=334426 RepID=A0A0R3PHT9_ANGCS|nr:unnamed protein product [Angiostrongylus costaricensis]